MTTTAGKQTTELRFARTEGTGGDHERLVTLEDLVGFLAAARAAEVPGDTPVQVPSIFGASPVSYIQVSAEVTEASGVPPEAGVTR